VLNHPLNQRSGANFQARASKAAAGAPVFWKEQRQNPLT
jgi:hypothetical protein